MKFSFLETPVAGIAEIEPVRTPLEADLDASSRCAALAENLGLPDLAARLVVRWNGRMRSTAGRATWPLALIEINPRLREISPEEVRRTILHELAHLVAYERSPKRRIPAHGREWRRACVDLGIPGEKATHELSLPSRTLKRQWRYCCPGCESSFERVRRFKSRVACYECCRRTNGGDYHDDFRLRELSL